MHAYDRKGEIRGGQFVTYVKLLSSRDNGTLYSFHSEPYGTGSLAEQYRDGMSADAFLRRSRISLQCTYFRA